MARLGRRQAFPAQIKSPFPFGLPPHVLAPRLQITSGSDVYLIPIDNLAASVAPGASNDATQKYTPSSEWFDTTHNVGYFCVNNTPGAAIWAGLSGNNTGDQTITLTGDVTGSGTGSFAATIVAHAVTYHKIQTASQTCLLGNSAGAGSDFAEITIGPQLKLPISGKLDVNLHDNCINISGDQSTSSSAFANVANMTFPVSIGDIWTVEYALLCTGSAAGMVFQLTGPATPTNVTVFTQGNSTGVTAISTDFQTAYSTPTQAYMVGAFTGLVVIRAEIEADASHSGNVVLQFASATNGQTNVIKRGSHMRPRYVGNSIG
jgi:hypothetical protein